jgi:uncharacterized protein (DUF302 family)
MTYGIKKQTTLSFEAATEKVRDLLTKHGFGVLTEINIKTTLKKKIDVDTEPYIILGACNPPFAHRAIMAEPDIGLLLPCNVIVYVKEGLTYVNAIKPSVAMSMVESPELETIATEVEEKLTAVINGLD